MAKVGKSTTQRGYGAAHQTARQRWAPQVAAGTIHCARCHRLILPGQPWDLGHSDDRTTYTGPEHRRCNRTAGAVNAAAVTNAQRAGQRNSRAW